MKRVLITGPVASGKSTLARRLGQITGLPVRELDKTFWRSGLVETPRDEWVRIQQELIAETEWIMDGDLGPHDAIEVRLSAADTIILLDFSLVRCAWRAIRRSRERLDFWLWLLRYRKKDRPVLLQAISTNAPTAAIHMLCHPWAVERFVQEVVDRHRAGRPTTVGTSSERSDIRIGEI